MATERDRASCRERLTLLSDSGIDCESIQREAIDELQRVIGFDRWCSIRGDPETLISLGAIGEHGYGPRVPWLLELEYSGVDSAARDAVARRPAPAASLSAETGGDLARSARRDEVLRHAGIGDEAVVGAAIPSGVGGGSSSTGRVPIAASQSGISTSSRRPDPSSDRRCAAAASLAPARAASPHSALQA